MSNRVTIYIPDHLQPVLDYQPDRAETLSARIASIIERYGLLVARSTPELTRAEWCLILDACNGIGLNEEPAEMVVQIIAPEVFDHNRLNRGGAKWDLTDQQVAALYSRLAAMSVAERLAIVERIGRFWRTVDMPTDEALAAAGIVPSDGPQEQS